MSWWYLFTYIFGGISGAVIAFFILRKNSAKIEAALVEAKREIGELRIKLGLK